MNSNVPDRLAYLHAKIEACTQCGLHTDRKRVVFGEGSHETKIALVGEAPGRNEDLQGRPFVGRAGTLLVDMLQQAGLKRQDVFITNVLCCRPPDNRDPTPEEIKCCAKYLHAKLFLLQPVVVVALGRFAGNLLCGTQLSMAELVGIPRTHTNPATKVSFTVLPTYHPAYLLRQQDPALTQRVVEHLKMAVQMVG